VGFTCTVLAQYLSTFDSWVKWGILTYYKHWTKLEYTTAIFVEYGSAFYNSM